MFKFFKIDFWLYVFVYARAENLINKKFFVKAIDVIVKYLEKKRYTTESIYYLLGKAHYGNRNNQLAIDSFLYSIENNPNNDVYKANTYFYLGLVYFDCENYNEAKEFFNKAIKIKEIIKFQRDIVISLPDLYCYLGRCYNNLGQVQKAYKIFDQGLKYEPNNKALQRELSIVGNQRNQGVETKGIGDGVN